MRKIYRVENGSWLRLKEMPVGKCRKFEDFKLADQSPWEGKTFVHDEWFDTSDYILFVVSLGATVAFILWIFYEFFL